MNTTQSKLLRSAIHRILIAASCAPALMTTAVQSAELPVACIAGTCGVSSNGELINFSSFGQASYTSIGNTLTVTQSTERATLNWKEFNVGVDGKVIFNQPSSTSIALNRIFQSNPSTILGQVTANGEIYLVNPNGIVFGKTAQVNAAGILASTLSISDSVFKSGIAAPSLVQNNMPALQADATIIPVDENGDPVKIKLLVEEGAKLATTGTNGRILLAAQNIDNAGSITAADGQVILAAGDKVFLQASDKPALRGLLVEVGVGGEVWNRATGQISTPRGNSTLIGYAVNQEGRVSATTTVAVNGSIRLLARDSAAFDGTTLTVNATRTGSLTLGSNSETNVTPELQDKTTAVDAQTQEPSYVELMGHQVTLHSGSALVANGGRVDLSAVKDPSRGKLNATGIADGRVIEKETPAGEYDAGSQLRIESGATIDLSGSDATLPMSRNLVSVELRASELADSPNQRDSAIRGQPLVVDVRQGTPLGDISGAIAGIGKTIAERAAAGGTAVLVSDGDIVAAAGARFDVSGGRLNYEAGVIQTSQLIGADGKIYDVGVADPNRTYTGLVSPTYRRVDDKWGQISVTPLQNTGHYESGYVEGKSAGTLQFVAPTMVLNGTFVGESVSGPLQRAADKTPSGGTLVLGLASGIISADNTADYYGAPSVDFVGTAPHIVVGSGASISTLQTLSLPVDYLNRGFTQTRIYSNGTVKLTENTPLNLATGSVFSLSAERIELDSSIQSLGGKLTFTSRDTFHESLTASFDSGIEIGAAVNFDVRGAWSNDSQFTAGVRPLDPLFYSGGSVSFMVANVIHPARLRIGDDVNLLASGGAQITQGGSIVAGSGGTIQFAAGTQGNRQSAAIDIGARVTMEAFGVLGAAGGNFLLTAPAIQIVNDNVWSRPQSFDADKTAFLRVGSGLFSEYGFSDVQLTATQQRDPLMGLSTDVIQIQSDVDIHAQVKSALLNTDAAQHASGGAIAAFSQVSLPEPFRRRSESVSFAGTLYLGSTLNAGNVSVQRNASLRADSGGSFSFSALGSILLDGAIDAPSGKITATILAPTESDGGYVANQQIRVGDHSVLNVAGTTLYTPNDLQLLKGVVGPGGSINLAANRGAIHLAAGSMLDVSGTAAPLDILSGAQVQSYVRQVVASNAGAINISAREDINLSGDMQAFAGVGSTGHAQGGSLSVKLSRGSVDPTIADTFPGTEHIVELNAHDAMLVNPLSRKTMPQDATPNATDGIVKISADFIKRSGFDALALTTSDEVKSAGGQIVLGSGLNLNLDRSISLDAARISVVDGGIVSLTANYLAMGNTSTIASDASSEVGNGQLRLNASFIDLLGSSVLSGIRLATFNSDSDIRMRGTRRTDGSILGSLNIAGDLQFNAARIYAATATNFNVLANGGVTDRIQILQRGVSTDAPLSVASSIAFSARDIEQGGTLLAPFGAITLSATNSVVLLDGSLTSVSGEGTVFPYGSVSNGAWSYSNAGASMQFESLATPKISLKSDNLIYAGSKSVIDISGGGDLYAYEWVPGTGGTRDALSAENSQAVGLYAILPSLRGQFAPYDPQEFAKSTLQPGDSIYLSGLGDLQSGIYPLLPARYALLPGAYLVSAVAGTLDATPGAVTTMLDGTLVVAGYRTFGTTSIGGSRYSGFAIHPGSYGRALAQYDDFYASSFLNARAARLELDRIRSPLDAGLLSIDVQKRLEMQAALKVTAGQDGEGAAIEISAPHLVVTASGGDGDMGTVDIGADRLVGWKPSRLLLGATRNANDALSVGADDVTVKSGAKLIYDEVVLAAKEHINLEKDSEIASRSGESNHVPKLGKSSAMKFDDASSAASAVIAVSDVNEWLLDRANASGEAGSIDMAASAIIASRGAVTIDAPQGAEIKGSVRASDARIIVGANQLVFADQQQANALTVSLGLQAQLQSANSLRLRGGASISFLRNADIQLKSADSSLSIDTPLLNAAQGVEINVAATDVAFIGGDASTRTLSAGTATFSIDAQSLQFGKGSIDIQGFSRATWVAGRQAIGVDMGRVRLAGDLDLITQQFNVATAAETKIEASGNARLIGSGSAVAAPNAGLGGSLTVKANDIEDSVAIRAASGLVTLEATGDLDIGSGAVIDVSGRMVSAGGRQLGSSGGSIRLSSGRALTLANGASLNADAAGDGSGGRLKLLAVDVASIGGSVSARSVEAARGGSFEVEAGSIVDFAALNAKLQNGHFDELQHVHVRTGGLQLAAGDTATARSINWTTDGGSILIAGAMHANSSDLRGSIGLYGANGVTINGELNTDALDGGARGGDMEIGTLTGAIDIAPTAQLSAKGTDAKGALNLRAPHSLDDVAIESLAADLSKLAYVAIAPIFNPSGTNGTIAAQLDSARTDAAAFVGQFGAGIKDRLNASDNTSIKIRPDIELLATGDVTLSSLSLKSWRFDGEPGALTVRAAGNVAIAANAAISDGYETSAGTNSSVRVLDLQSGDSSTIRIIAGANLSSADPGATSALPNDLTFGQNAIVRTGTGSLLLGSSNNVEFKNGASAYTGGERTFESLTLNNNILLFPKFGGTLKVIAENDLIGTPIAQSVSTWQYRGTRSSNTAELPRLYGINISAFRWNLGALGGGDVIVVAGNDVTNLSAAAADSARIDNDVLSTFGGGSMSITSGHDIASGDFFVGKGSMSIDAGGSLSSVRSDGAANPVGTLLWMGDARATVRARNDLLVESVLNPTLLQPLVSLSGSRMSFFSTYSQDSAVTFESTAGNVVFGNQKDRLSSFIESQILNGSVDVAFNLYPASMIAHAISGDVALRSQSFLYPSPIGQLDLFAGRDIYSSDGKGAGGSAIRMSDADLADVNTLLSPSTATAFVADLAAKFAFASIHRDDPTPVTIAAGRDIVGANFDLAKSATIAAGRDIIDMSLLGQNMRAGDITLIRAGRDFSYRAAYEPPQISLGGPGRLDIIAGRDVDLGVTFGVTTIGALGNATLPSAEGADITIMAGIGTQPDYAAFIDKIIAKSSSYSLDLVGYIKQTSGKTLALDAALSEFRKLAVDEQRPFIDKVFFSELVQSGREANNVPNAGFDRGYAAIDALFPGSRNSATSDYKGNLNMSFSRIYTLAGGDIALVIPGGLVNVGLANPPTSISKRDADKLGIVAQRAGDVKIFADQDVLVNKSRVFTLLGGDIAVWSTHGNIDAGRGAKSAISAPQPRVQIDASGKVKLDLSGAVAGSGIRGILTATDIQPGDVDLIAPTGFVNAGDAGIGAAGNLNIAAQRVIGLDNIQVGGVSTGVPAEAGGLGASLSGVSNAASGTSNASNAALNNDDKKKDEAAPIAQSAMSWLEVFVVGLGEDTCKQDDIECLKKQKVN